MLPGPADIGCRALYIFISVGIALLARGALFERWREASGDQSAFRASRALSKISTTSCGA